MKFLENIGNVKRVRKPGTKKVFFYMDKDIIKLNIKKMEYMRNAFIGPAKTILPTIIDKYKDKAKTDEAKKRLKIIENYKKQALQFEGLMNKFIEDLKRCSDETNN